MMDKIKAQTKLRNILIFFYILSVFFAFHGISARLKNESTNKSVVPVLDYHELKEASKSADIKFEEVLKRFREAGAYTLAVDEKYGFQQEDLARLRDNGFEILLRPDIASHKPYGYYDDIVKRYGVKYIIFNNSDGVSEIDKDNLFEKLILQNRLVVGGAENLSQTGLVGQKELTNLIEKTDYSVIRAYIIPDSDLEKISTSEMFYRWFRCIVDRGIRIVYVKPLKNPNLTQTENLNETIDSVSELSKFAALSGFSLNSKINKLSVQALPFYHRFAVGLSVMFGFLLYIFYLFKPKIKTLIISFVICLSIIAGLNLAMGNASGGIWAACGAILYPSFSSLLFLKYIKNNSNRNIALQIMCSLGIIWGINSLGMYLVATSLCDVGYLLGMRVYNAVAISFILPLVFFAANYFSCFIGFENLKLELKKLKNFKFSLKYTILFLIFWFIFYVYIARSGNDMGISATKFELNFRELLEKYLYIRPRFKEFAVGYPALFALIFLYKKLKDRKLVLLLGFFVTMASVSMVNSFCHGFTSVMTSVQRTLNGILIGLPSGMLTLFLVLGINFFYNKIKGQSVFVDK